MSENRPGGENTWPKIFYIFLWVTGIVVISSLISLIFALATVNANWTEDLGIYSKIARTITSVLMLLLSLNLIKLTISYQKFSKAAAKCKEASDCTFRDFIHSMPPGRAAVPPWPGFLLQ